MDNPTARQKYNWWRINRSLESIEEGVTEPVAFGPSVYARKTHSGLLIDAWQEKLLGDQVRTTVTANRDEVYGHFIYVQATQTTTHNSGALGTYTAEFRAHPRVVLEETFTASALCRVLGAAKQIEHELFVTASQMVMK